MSSLLDRISKLEQQLAVLRAEAEKEEKGNKRWRAKLLGRYWYITDYCSANLGYAGSKSDGFHYDTHNYFRTEDEAQKYAKVLETERQLRKFADEHNDKIDWEDIDQDKWCLGYSYRALKTMTAVAMYTREARTIYFSSQEIAKQAIDEIGEEEIKEYLTYEW